MKFLEPTIPDWVMPALGVALAGAAIWWIVLARALGWMSPDAVAAISSQRAEAAVVAYATPACVSRFEHQANAVGVWQKLNQTKEDWHWGDFISKQPGLIGEPGQTVNPTLASAIATNCASQVQKLTSINGVKLL